MLAIKPRITERLLPTQLSRMRIFGWLRPKAVRQLKPRDRPYYGLCG